MSANAGSGVVRSSPSRRGSAVEGSTPLQLFLKHLPALRHSAAQTGVSPAGFNVCYALPKIALEKWSIEERKGTLLLSDGDAVRVAPISDQASYYVSLLEQLDAKKNVKLINEQYAAHLKSVYKLKKQHDEYLYSTMEQIELPGGRNKTLRWEIRKALQLAQIEEYDPSHQAEYVQLIALWYKQNVELKFRAFDKTSQDWLLMNWSWVKERVPDIRCLGVRRLSDMRLVGLHIAALHCEGVWSMYTDRFDRESGINAVNRVGRQQMAFLFGDHLYENDGTADTPSLRAYKDRHCLKKMPMFQRIIE